MIVHIKVFWLFSLSSWSFFHDVTSFISLLRCFLHSGCFLSWSVPSKTWQSGPPRWHPGVRHLSLWGAGVFQHTAMVHVSTCVAPVIAAIPHLLPLSFCVHQAGSGDLTAVGAGGMFFCTAQFQYCIHTDDRFEDMLWMRKQTPSLPCNVP